MALSLAARVCGGALAFASVTTLGLTGPAAAAGPDGCPCTLWPGDAVPAIVDDNDGNAVELGVQFTVDVAAPITGVRFYKSAANTGPHVASLWTADGTLLARAPFGDETASGWQQVSFPTAVAAVPGTRYVASYHTTTGHYSVDKGYFAAGGRHSGILHAEGADAGVANGVFSYGPAPRFPDNTFRSNNYWVDVVVGGKPARTLTALAISGVPGSLVKGATRQLGATGTYSDGTTAAVAPAWTSSNPAVATVSAAGVVQAAGVGTATITASLDGVSASAPVTVTAATLTSVSVTPGSATLRLLGTQQLTATATYSDGTTVDVTGRARWTTSNLLVAIPGNAWLYPGRVLGLLPGTAVITASFDGLRGTAPVTVRW